MNCIARTGKVLAGRSARAPASAVRSMAPRVLSRASTNATTPSPSPDNQLYPDAP